MPRSTKCTDEVVHDICILVKAGVDIQDACAQAGIGRSTLYDWRARALDDEEPYASAMALFEQAVGTRDTELTLHVARAARLDWRAALALLEKHKGKRVAEPVSEALEEFLDMIMPMLKPDSRDDLLDCIARAKGQRPMAAAPPREGVIDAEGEAVEPGRIGPGDR